METREKLLELLNTKSLLKQEIYASTKTYFKELKKNIQQEVEVLQPSISDPSIRMSFEDKGEYEAMMFVGSDVLVYHMHNNVFCLPPDHLFWKTAYLKKDESLGYFGVFHVYNFLAQSYLLNRKEDIGFLLARIFINRKGHFFIEGVDPLSSKYAKLGKNVVSSTLFNEISLSLSISAVEFDLYVPAYNSIGQINISQLEELSSNLGVQKVKRLGFKPDQTIDGVYDGI